MWWVVLVLGGICCVLVGGLMVLVLVYWLVWRWGCWLLVNRFVWYGFVFWESVLVCLVFGLCFCVDSCSCLRRVWFVLLEFLFIVGESWWWCWVGSLLGWWLWRLVCVLLDSWLGFIVVMFRIVWKWLIFWFWCWLGSRNSCCFRCGWYCGRFSCGWLCSVVCLIVGCWWLLLVFCLDGCVLLVVRVRWGWLWICSSLWWCCVLVLCWFCVIGFVKWCLLLG